MNAATHWRKREIFEELALPIVVGILNGYWARLKSSAAPSSSWRSSSRSSVFKAKSQSDASQLEVQVRDRVPRTLSKQVPYKAM